jgi:hypothetical protein
MKKLNKQEHSYEYANEMFNSLLKELQKKGIQVTPTEEFIKNNVLTESQEIELFRVSTLERLPINEELLVRALKKKNRIRTNHNRLDDYKNKECCIRKNKKVFNKEEIRNLRKLRKSFRGFLLLILFLAN